MKWEYKRINLDIYLGGERENEDEPLNEMGNNEWELFHIHRVGDGKSDVAFFKRPLKEKVDKKQMIEDLIKQLTKRS